MRYVANARTYSVNPQAAAWKELFGWLARQSGVEFDILDHAFPLPLSDLWSRVDLGCAFMCGFPFMLATRASNADKSLAAELNIDESTACLVIERRTWRNGEPITAVRLVHPGPLYDPMARFTPSG